MKKWLRIEAPFDDGGDFGDGGGTDAGDNLDFGDDLVNQGDGGDGDGDGDGDGLDLGQQGSVGLDYNALAAANANAIGQVLERFQPRGGQQQQQVQQISDEDFNRLTEYYVPDEAFVETLFSENSTPQQKHQALQQLVQNIYKHANKVTGFGLQQVREELGQRLQPYEQLRQERIRETFESNLIKSFPSLGNYRDYIGLAVNALKSTGKQFQSDDEAYAAVAQMTAALVKQSRLTNGSARGNGGVARGRKMPPMAGMTSSGGQSSSAGGGSGKKQPAWMSVLGK